MKTLETNQELVLKIQEDLPQTEYSVAAETLGNALITGDFTSFESMLHEDIVLVIYDFKTITGRAETIEYWKGWRGRYIVTKKITDLEVIHSSYKFRACLRLYTMLAMFMINNGKVKTMMLSPKKLSPSWYYFGLDNMLALPMDIDYAESHIQELEHHIFNRNNLVPCLNCGCLSDDLKWQGFSYKDKSLIYTGRLSICPICHKVVEVCPESKEVIEDTGDIQHFCIVKSTNEDIAETIAEEGKAYIRKFHEFEDKLQIIIAEDKNKWNKSELFNTLSDLSLPADYFLGLRLASSYTNDIGDESKFYIYDKNGTVYKSVLDYIYVKSSAIAAWEIYLLKIAETIMPVYWHGGYIVRSFIFNESDLKQIKALEGLDWSNITKNDMLTPYVKFEMLNEHEAEAHVYCTFWNDWKGLVREHVKISITEGKVSGYENVGEFVIHPYDCGILF